jgi:hypothetical protein
MVVVILTGHAPVRTHLRSVGLFEGDPTCRFYKKGVDGRLVCSRAGLARKHSGLIPAHCAPNRFGCLLSSPVGAHAARV